MQYVVPRRHAAPMKTTRCSATLYDRTVGQWATEARHVATVVAGATVQYKSGSQKGNVYEPLVACAPGGGGEVHQRRGLPRPGVSHPSRHRAARIEANGMLNRIGNAQNRVLTALFQNARLNRLIEQPAMHPGQYTAARTWWTTCSEASGARSTRAAPKIDVYRRELQNNYLDMIDSKLNPPAPAAGAAGGRGGGAGAAANTLVEDARSQLRGEVTSLRTSIRTATTKAADRETQCAPAGGRPPHRGDPRPEELTPSRIRREGRTERSVRPFSAATVTAAGDRAVARPCRAHRRPHRS